MGHLRSFTWQGIGTDKEVDLLHCCLQRNITHLQALHLGLSEAHDFNDSGKYRALMTSLTMQPFPALRELSLCNFSFKTCGALALPHLQSLTLRNCRDQLLLLRSLSRLESPIRLRSFEISFDELEEDIHPHFPNPVIQFLTSFHSLEHLHLSVSNPVTLDGHFLGIVPHHPSLKCFVYHERKLLAIESDETLPGTHDIPTPWSRELSTYVGETKLTNLGLCLAPSAAVSRSPKAFRTKCQNG
jgi:hypothetical protein